MKNIEKMMHINRAASSAGLESEETRGMLDGSLFSKADLGLLALLKESLGDVEKRKMLLDNLESRNKKPVPLSEIINVFDKFSDLQKKLENTLTKEDIKLINFTIKYLEDWFYRGEWTNVPNRQKNDINSYAYFSVPAGIINMITKIKETPKYSKDIVDLDRNKLAELGHNVGNFVNDYLKEENLNSLRSQKNLSAEESNAIKTIIQNRSKIKHTFSESEGSLKTEFSGGGSFSKASDLYFLKTCIIAAEVLRRQGVKGQNDIFIPDAEIPSVDKYVKFDFSNGKDKNSSMHYHKARLPYCKFVVEYLKKSI